MIHVNSQAPDFKAYDQDEKLHTNKEYRGKWVVLYFYPKDSTPGCTKEACGFRDAYEIYKKHDIIVLGVSKDSINSHKKFAQNNKLDFPLLSDPEKKILTAYGALGKKKFMGREFIGSLRMTFLIDKKGIIRKIYEKVDPLIHAKEILSDIENGVE